MAENIVDIESIESFGSQHKRKKIAARTKTTIRILQTKTTTRIMKESAIITQFLVE